MHKHSEVLEAIAQGKSVEFSVDGGSNWQEMPPSGTLNPITHHYMPWRVKQEFERKDSTFYYWIDTGYGIPIISYCDNPEHADIEIKVNLNTYELIDRKFL